MYCTAKGSNVVDVDGNRYVDLAAGFGALLLGHAHPHVLRAIELQSRAADAGARRRVPGRREDRAARAARGALPGRAERAVILGQSGADAVTAALKTALLATGKPGVVAFEGAYHGLATRRSPPRGFRAELPRAVRRAAQPARSLRRVPATTRRARSLASSGARFELAQGDVGAVLVEPILGRGGVRRAARRVPARARRSSRARPARCSIADEIWTGLGRAGRWLFSVH